MAHIMWKCLRKKLDRRIKQCKHRKYIKLAIFKLFNIEKLLGYMALVYIIANFLIHSMLLQYFHYPKILTMRYVLLIHLVLRLRMWDLHFLYFFKECCFIKHKDFILIWIVHILSCLLLCLQVYG
jgi:hypothetical protein